MIDFLKNDVSDGSIVIMSVRDSSRGDNFTDEQAAYLERLGATDDCPVKIGESFR